MFGCPGDRLLYTVDMLVESVDFDLAYATGEDIGWKSLAINVSDIAAMGGRPARAVTALSLPPDTDAEVVNGICDGLAAAAARWQVGLAGGDLSEGGEISISVALLGHVDGEPVLRSGAGDEDAICVTGSLGGAAGGLVALRNGLGREGKLGELVTRQLRPEPRLDAGIALAGLGASAMIDLSDGLAVDLGHIVDSSHTGCTVDLDAVPLDENLDVLPPGLGDALELAVVGGEDFELLFTIDAERVPEARDELARLGVPVTRIGAIGGERQMIGDDDLAKWRDRGWQHLRNR